MSYRATKTAVEILVRLRAEPSTDLEQRLMHLEIAVDDLMQALCFDLSAHTDDCRSLLAVFKEMAKSDESHRLG